MEINRRHYFPSGLRIISWLFLSHQCRWKWNRWHRKCV